MFFLLNKQQKISLSGINPNTTVLDFLRQHQLLGSKEGCASGDCGACVAVVVELCANDKNSVDYKSINTCIALVCNLAGKHLITVDGLTENNQLHPVQQAMVETHGSQCGFCTPGFVMSLFALYHNENNINLTKIEHALSGNLCRCTGYKPIIEAAFLMFEKKLKQEDDYYSRHQKQVIKQLQHFANNAQDIHINYVDDRKQQLCYSSPNNIEQFAKLVKNNPTAKIVAGASDLSLEITQKVSTLKHIISLSNVSELQLIKDCQDELEIFAAVSYQQAWESLIKYYPSLENFLLRFASLPIRNWATICGNIANASPIGDMPPVLLALDASLKLRLDNKTRTIKLNDFFISYKKTQLQAGEFVESVIIPKLKSDEKLMLYKISKRFEDDISAVAIAIKLKLTNNKLHSSCIAFGGMADIPKRAPLVEKTLLAYWQTDNLEQHALNSLQQTFTPLDDMRASADYRLAVCAKLLTKCILQIKGEYVVDLSVLNDSLYQKLNTEVSV